ncbi:MAG: BtpA/SgcQ family protein, partial [Thermomicrobiaceae bacterium]|nr:BtpA/SgcQ family protein [Thermomicrobiaceae bacterium]
MGPGPAAGAPAKSAPPPGPEIIGVIHLAPLPGAPRNQSTISEIIEAALRDALAYQQGGARGLIVENYGDVPFAKDHVEPHTVAAMTLAVRTIVSAASTVRVGVNVLRNDALAAIAIAAIGGASFIRVNVHTGVMVTDQGIIEGRAYETLRYRRLLDQSLQIWADVMVKHATPLDGPTLEEAALDTVRRGLADAV